MYKFNCIDKYRFLEKLENMKGIVVEKKDFMKEK